MQVIWTDSDTISNRLHNRSFKHTISFETYNLEQRRETHNLKQINETNNLKQISEINT